ncbi:hypothetical protein HMPREF9442_01929 [Paraprevotella xylaniphila YIT 11841]|uniref:Uncharacterized protein n=1 Tax=Paraprevotella xylaniphila YIT 11841 TaxID=762982 RepID=F3QUQ6_9BACT|nr:hypothetical protein HMPREF9442_01929 [Paraprevotella xylaniphila YIT 11841]
MQFVTKKQRNVSKIRFFMLLYPVCQLKLVYLQTSKKDRAY